MGRKPNLNPTPVNPNKITKTCPVCGRSIAIRNGVIVQHGFQVSGRGHGAGFRCTPDCFGAGFEPWEVSKKGAVEYIEMLKKHILVVAAKDLTERKNQMEFDLVNAEINHHKKRVKNWKATE